MIPIFLKKPSNVEGFSKQETDDINSQKKREISLCNKILKILLSDMIDNLNINICIILREKWLISLLLKEAIQMNEQKMI